jgi:hypothetical protein
MKAVFSKDGCDAIVTPTPLRRGRSIFRSQGQSLAVCLIGDVGCVLCPRFRDAAQAEAVNPCGGVSASQQADGFLEWLFKNVPRTPAGSPDVESMIACQTRS